jgi:hypothetical protein
MGSVRWSDENLCGKVHNVREYSLAAGLRVQPVELARHFVEHLVDEVRIARSGCPIGMRCSGDT